MAIEAHVDLFDEVGTGAQLDWPICPKCGQDTLSATVDGLMIIGQPFSSDESQAFGLKCTQCAHETSPFIAGVFHPLQ